MPRFKYPADNRDQYRGKIKFTRYKPAKPSVRLVNTLEQARANSSDTLSDVSPAGPGSTRLSGLIEGDLSKLTFKDAPYTTFHGGGFEKTDDVVELLMPAGVQIADAVNFDNKDLGVKGIMALQSAASEGGASGAQLAALAVPFGDLDNIRKMIKSDNTGAVARTLASGLAAKVGDRTASTVSSISQVAVNPNTRSVFQGVPVRKFNFAFEMKASSIVEQQNIESIVHFFRSHLYPRQITIENVPIGFEFPDRFHIKMLYDKKQVGVDFLECHLEGVNTTYNGQSQAFYNNGGFTQVDLSLMFTEVRALTQEDIQLGVTSTGRTREESITRLAFGGQDYIRNLADDIRNIVNVFQ